MTTPDHHYFEAGDIRLQSGQTLPAARLAYKTYGALNARRDNTIVYPTWFASNHADNEWLIGPGRALDTERYFIIVPNSFGNGLSSSPSNQPPPSDRARFPRVMGPPGGQGPERTRQPLHRAGLEGPAGFLKKPPAATLFRHSGSALRAIIASAAPPRISSSNP